MKVVLDTSVVVAALRSEYGASNALLQLAMLHSFEILATPALFLEYEEVIRRREQREIHRLSEADVDEFLAGLAAIILPVRVYFQWRPQMQDADDEMVLEAALNGQADVIITHNLADFQLITARFGLSVWTPGRVLKELRT